MDDQILKALLASFASQFPPLAFEDERYHFRAERAGRNGGILTLEKSNEKIAFTVHDLVTAEILGSRMYRLSEPNLTTKIQEWTNGL